MDRQLDGAVDGERIAVTRGRGHDAPSLRRLLGVVLGVLGALVAGLIGVTTLQLRGSQSQSRAENRRTASFLLADGMRQSSNDLTNMVRLYVATGRPVYRRYYNQILAIRNGTAPRPRNYDSSFWDRVLARGESFVSYGPPESLVDQMRMAHFGQDEFRALKASLDASNGLARLELGVMNRVARRIHRGVDAAYLGDVRREYDRLIDPAYLVQKGKIMAAIGRFVDLVDNRTRRNVDNVRADNHALFVVQIAILGVIVLVGGAALTLASRVVVRPLDRLAAATRRIAGGDYDERAAVHGVAELEQVAAAFNEMAAAVQSDVRARERAERDAVAARQAAEQANRAKSDFIAAMSHEIRTPMIGVTGMLEVLSRTDLSAPQRHMIATAESSAQSLLQLIGDVLDFSKIEAAKLQLAPTTVDLRALVHAAVETFRHTASAKGLLLTSSLDERLAPAHVGDALRLRQIVTNFLSNAVKFTTVGGVETEVRVIEDRGSEQLCEVSVTDTGVGVTPEQQRRLFSDYAQADAVTAQRYGGTGLGRAICQRLAELMGGTVSMESVLGQGTTIRLTVPLPVGNPAEVDRSVPAVPDRHAATRPKPSREVARREGSLLLVAEDHAVNRTVLSHQLDIIGFEVDFAQDGTIAFDRYREGGYGLVFTDLDMPGLNGYELTAAIRRHDAQTGAAHVPIIALTANVMQGEPDRCRAAGMDDFAAKPTTIPFLAAKLRQWLPHLDWSAGGGERVAVEAPHLAADGTFDLAVLAEVTGGDTELSTTLMDHFMASTSTDLVALDLALAGHRIDEVRRLAHRIKGAARIVGARAIVANAERMETKAASGMEAAELETLARRLHDDFTACQSAITSMA